MKLFFYVMFSLAYVTSSIVYASALKNENSNRQDTSTYQSKTLQICQEALKAGDNESALATCRTQLKSSIQAEEVSKKPSFDTLYLYLFLVDVYHATGNSEKEWEYLNKAKQHPLFASEKSAIYQWQRRTGKKYYLTNEFQQAKKHLYQGLKIAEELNQQEMLAKSYNDVGLIESQLSNFQLALQHYQQSLNIKRALGNQYTIGTTLNNIGLTYSKLENSKQAIIYYEQALNEFLSYTQQESFDKRVFNNINHLYEDLALTYNKLQSNQDKLYQQKAADSINDKDSKREQVRALINIAHLQLENQQLDSAKKFLEKASELQDNHTFDLRLELNLQWGAYYLQAKDDSKAISYANSGIVIAEQKNNLLAMEKLYFLLSQAYLSSDAKIAYHYLQKHVKTREKFLEQKFNSELKSIQLEIDKKQIAHELMLQKAKNSDNQIRIQRLTNLTLATIISLLLVVGFVVFLWFKKRKEKQSLLLSIKFHKQQLLLLDSKYQNLTKDFDSIEQQILMPASLLTNNDLDEKLKDKVLQCKQQLREVLVNTMINAISIWESHTNTNRVELAEKSKIWTISIDNGTLRTRSLDKYLSLDKIPQNPRWRNVAGTCHFILADPDIPAADRIKLNQDLDEIMQIIKELSLNET